MEQCFRLDKNSNIYANLIIIISQINANPCQSLLHPMAALHPRSSLYTKVHYIHLQSINSYFTAFGKTLRVLTPKRIPIDDGLLAIKTLIRSAADCVYQ